jgi:hypothetical protein
VALFVTVLNTILYSIAWEYNWWRYEHSLFSWDRVTPVPIIYSAYWVITIWIFYFTFRRFWLYLIVNVIADSLFGVVLKLWKEVGIFNGDLPIMIRVLILISFSLIIYMYQIWYESAFSTDP